MTLLSPTLLVTRLEQARMFPTRRDGTMRKRVAFATDRAVQLNPLLSLVEDWMTVPGGYSEHLHKGFETVTLVFEGQVACIAANDGPRQVLGAGDVQWVNSGSGMMHAEMAEGDVEAHMIQLWLNLPAAQKLSEPICRTIASLAVPVVDRLAAKVRVIAGEFEGRSGPAQTGSLARLLDVRLEAGASFTLPIGSGQVGAVYVAQGTLTIGAHAAVAGDVVHFSSKLSDTLAFVVSEASHVVVVNAPPLTEPVIVNGPFIMNTATQIQQAYADFRAGTFAPLPSPS